jgi:hypothetical protein
VGDINTARRYYLLRARAAAKIGDSALASTWRTKQAGVEGEALPDDFPHASALAAVGYTTREDLDGADEDELAHDAGLGLRAAQAILAALAALT